MLNFCTKYCRFLSVEPEKRGKNAFLKSSQDTTNVNVFTAKAHSFAKRRDGKLRV